MTDAAANRTASVLDQVAQGVAAADREAAASLLEALAGNLAKASEIWEAFAAEAPGLDNPFTFLLAFGPERARRLHALHLEGRELGARLGELSGAPVRDALGLSEEVDVVQAYSQTRAGDTAESVAGAALETLAARRARILEVAGALRS